MATRPVRFEFMCDKEQLEYTFPLPRTLVRPDALPQDPQFANGFVTAITPLLHSYETKKKPAALHRVRNLEFAAHLPRKSS